MREHQWCRAEFTVDIIILTFWQQIINLVTKKF